MPEKNNKQPDFLEKAGDWLKSVAINMGDSLHLNLQYDRIKYNIEPTAKLEEVLMQTAGTLKNVEAIAINDNKQQLGKICKVAIEQKIITDLQIMQNKFNPNYNLGNLKFCDVVIYDFKGKTHTILEDYLIAMGKGKQVMQYLSLQSTIGKKIKHEMHNAPEIQRKHSLSAKPN